MICPVELVCVEPAKKAFFRWLWWRHIVHLAIRLLTILRLLKLLVLLIVLTGLSLNWLALLIHILVHVISLLI